MMGNEVKYLVSKNRRKFMASSNEVMICLDRRPYYWHYGICEEITLGKYSLSKIKDVPVMDANRRIIKSKS